MRAVWHCHCHCTALHSLPDTPASSKPSLPLNACPPARLPACLQRDYLERDANDQQLYKYLA